MRKNDDKKPPESKSKSSNSSSSSSSTATVVDLPYEVMMNIMSRLPPKTLLDLKVVCKTSYKLITDHFHTLISLRASRFSDYSGPCVIIHSHVSEDPQLSLLYINTFDDRFGVLRSFDVPATPSRFSLIGSRNSYFCLLDCAAENRVCLYDTLTRDYVELPTNTSDVTRSSVFGFGIDPVKQEYKVVRVRFRWDPDPLSGNHSDVEIITLGSSVWRSLGEIKHRLSVLCSGVLVNGRLHWTADTRRASAGRIVSFDFTDERFREISKPDFIDFERRSFSLVEIGGCLAAVFSAPYQSVVWVMKDYGVKESWVKVYVIPSRYPRQLGNVICGLKNGKILVKFKRGGLGYYNPNKWNCEDIEVLGLPRSYRVVNHAGSLLWIDTLLINH